MTYPPFSFTSTMPSPASAGGAGGPPREGLSGGAPRRVLVPTADSAVHAAVLPARSSTTATRHHGRATRRRGALSAPRRRTAGVTSIRWRAPAGDRWRRPCSCALRRPRGHRPTLRDDASEAFSTELAKAVVMSCGRPGAVRPVRGRVRDGGRAGHDRVEGFPRIGAGRRRRAAAPRRTRRRSSRSPSRRTPTTICARSSPTRRSPRSSAARRRGDGSAHRGAGHRRRRAAALAGGGLRRRPDRDGRVFAAAVGRSCGAA